MRSQKKHRPAKTIKVKRPFYEQLVTDYQELKERTQNHEHNKALLQQVLSYMRTIETNNTQTQADLDVRIEDLEADIRV